MTMQSAVIRAVRNSPRHVGRLAKAYAVLLYNSAFEWAQAKNRRIASTPSKLDQLAIDVRAMRGHLEADLSAVRRDLTAKESAEKAAKRPPNHCFASNIITLPAAIQNMEHLARGYRDEEIIKTFVKKVVGYTMVPYDGLATLADQVRYCEENAIEGDFVELGTWKGGCLGIMALANMIFAPQRRTIHGFDSFAGIPMPRRDKDDMEWARVEMRLSDEQCDGSLKPAEQLIGPKSDVEALIAKVGYPRERVQLHEGWFQSTVPVAEIEKIAILRIDGDLYDSYVVALDHLYDKVVPGGFVILDDWCLEGCRKAVTEFFQRRNLRPYLAHVDSDIRYFQKPIVS